MTRETSAARKPTGNTVPRAIGTSPNMSPGRRSPTTRSIPSTNLTASIRPSSTAKSARSPPWSAAYSPGTRLISAAARESRSRSAGPSAAKTLIPPISSVVTMTGTRAATRPPPAGGPPAGRRRPEHSLVQRGLPRQQRYSVTSVRARRQLLGDIPLTTVAQSAQLAAATLVSLIGSASGKAASTASALQAPGFRGDVIVFHPNAADVTNLARNLHLAGIRRNACTRSRRLITRRSQVQILPPLLKRPWRQGIFSYWLLRRRCAR